MPFHVLTGATAPTSVPQYVGQHYIDTTNRVTYESVGNESVDDWRKNGDDAFPPFNAPPMPGSLPGSNNLGVFASSTQWFRFVAPNAGFTFYRLLINGLTSGSTWSVAYFDTSRVQVGAAAESILGDVAAGVLLQINESNFTPGNTYYIRIVNHSQKFSEAGTIYYTHAN